jgi:hypothetical protein
LLDHESIGLARIGAEYAETAGIGEDRYSTPLRQWLTAERECKIEHFTQRFGANDTGLMKQGFGRNVVGS